MKTQTPFAVIVGVLALMGLSHAEETATPKPPKKGKFIAPEILVKYDKDKDGNLSKEEKVEMKKDQTPKVPKEPEVPKP